MGWVLTHLWNLLLKDSEDTLRHVCRAVLENPEVPQEQRTKLAEGVLEIARAFQVLVLWLRLLHDAQRCLQTGAGS